MSNLSQILTSLNQCVDANTNAFTAFEHSAEKVCYLLDLMNLPKSKKPILMHHPDSIENLEITSITDEMLESEDDLYPKITPLIGLNKCNYRVTGYLAVKSITEYESFILLSYTKEPSLSEEEVQQLTQWCVENKSVLSLKSIRKEFKSKIAYRRDCEVSEVRGKDVKKHLKKLSEKVLVSDILKDDSTLSLLPSKNIVCLRYTNEFVELLFVDDSHRKDVFCLTQFDQ